MELVFRNPPPPTGRKRKAGVVQRFINALAEHPGEWAVFRERVTASSAYVYRSKYGKEFPGTEWELRCETPDEPSLRTIFVRVARKGA